MTDEIKPALTSDEWRNLRSNIEALNVMFDASPWGRAPEGNHFREMAIANWKLPDDDPRKITCEDVADLRELAARDPIGVDEDGRDIPHLELSRIAAKLAAFLPPDDVPDLTRSR